MQIEISRIDIAVLKEQGEGLMLCLTLGEAPSDVVSAVKHILEAINE